MKLRKPSPMRFDGGGSVRSQLLGIFDQGYGVYISSGGNSDTKLENNYDVEKNNVPGRKDKSFVKVQCVCLNFWRGYLAGKYGTGSYLAEIYFFYFTSLFCIVVFYGSINI